MDEHKQNVMVALRPITSDWCAIALPHLTLVFAGDKADLKPTDFNNLAKTVASIAMNTSPIQLNVIGFDVFGPEGERVDVLRLQANPTLREVQRRVSEWSVSEFPFNPHCTIGPEGSRRILPLALAFDRIMLSWGEEELNFWLRP